jgi:hypothetical protein
MSVMSEYVDGLKFGETMEYEKMNLMPIIGNPDEGSVYLTLKEALDMNLLKITEVNDSGSVPELKAVNKSELPVLILDGEELIGAKQNRVLNTTVLLKGGSETVIPVSCTEEGRWSYNSREFYDEGSVISHSMRDSKRRSVSDSVRRMNSYSSDQSSIWNEIRGSIHRENLSSPTNAHRDIYDSKLQDITEYLDAFTSQEGQVGILVCINGKIKGIDTVSSPVAYRSLHDKLLKSYAIEAVLGENSEKNSTPKNSNLEKKSKQFIKQISESNESKYKSIGHGWDHRFESDSVLGSALICQSEVIHASFFKNEVSRTDRDPGHMAGFRTRRGFRS